ncbi:solute carrier family 22 member 7-like [Dermacentor andersoni]|uniref:solute carrier family 22 member 7-like n=1 Tax=Dermacentor andersoni TaxID=34620 RepID=UPI002155F7B3|nr:solute carrier family 22 member 7-like [Dermacentor andersoni]
MDLLLPPRLAGVDRRTSESLDCEEGFGYGPFQKRMLLLILLGAFSVNCQTVVVSLVTSDVDHWCKPLARFNISAADWKNIATPTEADGRFSRCRAYERCKPPAGPAVAGWWYNRYFLSERELQDTNDTRDAPCEEWEYDIRTAETSAVSFWNMVCHRRLLPAAILTLQNTGAVISLILIGAFVDYVGRRAMLVGSAVVMATGTVCTFVSTGYAQYAVARFLTVESVAVHTVFTALIPFEVMTHAHRPQQLLLLAVMGLTLSDVWMVIVKSLVVDWRLKQIICLAPTALLLPVLFTARESPRWLVAKGRLEAAEAVMMQGAKTNNVPIAVTACLVVKLRKQIKNQVGRESADREGLLDCHSLRRRALAMFVVCFCISFVFFMDAFSTAQYNESWIPSLTVVFTLATYMAMHFLITDVALVRVLTACFLLTGVIQCAISIAAGSDFSIIAKTLLVLSKGITNVLIVRCFTYVLELFPSAVWAGFACWALASRRVSDMFAAVILVLKPAGREDVVFAFAGLFPFASLLIIRALPRATVVEEARIVARRPSESSRMSMDHMKRTLEQRCLRKKSKTSSLESSRSSRKSHKSGIINNPGSSSMPRRSRNKRVPE